MSEWHLNIKTTISERPAVGSGRAGGRGGLPPGGAAPGGGGKSARAADSASSIRVCDKKDTNKDGTVSWQEEQDYNRTHPDEARKAATTSEIDDLQAQLYVLA